MDEYIDSLKVSIINELQKMSEDEINDFGVWLFNNFFENIHKVILNNPEIVNDDENDTYDANDSQYIYAGIEYPDNIYLDISENSDNFEDAGTDDIDSVDDNDNIDGTNMSFDLDDIIDMLSVLTDYDDDKDYVIDILITILNNLKYIEIDDSDIDYADVPEYDVIEKVTPFMRHKNFNRKIRKFYANKHSKVYMKVTAHKRKRENRLHKVERHRYYLMNAKRKSLYNKSYRNAVNKKIHRVKLRRRVGMPD
jgi:hypothetical protein